MKSKTSAKVFLDGIMLVLLTLLYSYRVISPTFHEVGGLALGGMFIIHCMVNVAWISGISKRITSGRLPKKTVLKWVVDVLLAVFMIFIIVSGVFISITVLTNITSSSTIWRSLHVPISIIGLILAGIHLGLGWTTVQKTIRIKLSTAVSSVLCLLLVAGGAFGAYTLDIPQKIFSGTMAGMYASDKSSGIIDILWYGLFMSLFTVVTYYIDKLVHHKSNQTLTDRSSRRPSTRASRRAAAQSNRPVAVPRPRPRY
ncbi:MAG: DUF4405 domain-containing protein [Coriobacteriia bacterium]|nr:DUF4405 domain-containing protein [Coriobacteriia bacterium]